MRTSLQKHTLDLRARKITAMRLLGQAQFHGANRLADKTSRWFWAPALLFLLGLAITLVLMTVKRFQENPTYMVQIDKFLTVERFPAVVLCPEINFVEEKMDQFMAKVQYPPSMNSTRMREILPQLAAFYALDVVYNLQDLLRIEQLLDYNGIDVETAGEFLTATCEETAIRCRWNGVMVNCSGIFRMEFTGDGFCCVFNGRSLKRQHVFMMLVLRLGTPTFTPLGYHCLILKLDCVLPREMEKHGTDIAATHPDQHKYTRLFGHNSGLMIAVNQSQTPTVVDLSYKWVATLTSQHFVDVSMNGTALNPGSEQWITFYTIDYQIGAGARLLRQALRKCNLSTDKLRYFPKYSKTYCTLEQEIANTLEKCKCVRVNHPKPPGACRCGAAMLQCSTQALVAFDSSSTICPMTCDVQKTSVVASSFQLDDTVNTVEPFYRDLDFKKVSVVRIFLQSRRQPTLERWSYFSYLDLFSQIGGMFNVFFGCSILTLLGLLQLGWHVIAKQWQKLRK